MNGVDSRYMGVELNFVYKPVKWFELSGMFACADNTWQNDPVGYYYNSSGQALASLGDRNVPATITTPLSPDHLFATIDQKGIKVGGSAQMTGALGVQFRPFNGFRIGADWTCNARNFSDFSLSNNSSVSIAPDRLSRFPSHGKSPSAISSTSMQAIISRSPKVCAAHSRPTSTTHSTTTTSWMPIQTTARSAHGKTPIVFSTAPDAHSTSV